MEGEPGPSSCQSTEAFSRISFPRFLARAVRTWKFGAVFIFALVSVEYCKLDSSGDSVVIRAQCLDRQWTHVLHQYFALLNEFCTFHGVVDSDPEVFSLRSQAEWGSVLSRCFSSQSQYALLALGNLEITSTRFTWLAVVMMAGQRAGTGPCETVLVPARCIDRCGVAIHTH